MIRFTIQIQYTIIATGRGLQSWNDCIVIKYVDVQNIYLSESSIRHKTHDIRVSNFNFLF